MSVVDIAHGNFTPEVVPSSDVPIQSDVFVDKDHRPLSEMPGNIFCTLVET